MKHKEFILVELCNIDMLIEVGGKAKVIIEIEESDVKPIS